MRSFFGSLDCVLSLELPASAALKLRAAKTFVLVGVCTCTTSTVAPVPDVEIHYYSEMRALNLVDLTTVQCAIGRVHAGNVWAIIDRTGACERAWYAEDDSE